MATLTDRQRKALRWVLLEAIDISTGRLPDLTRAQQEDEVADIESLIELAHPDDRAELRAANELKEA